MLYQITWNSAVNPNLVVQVYASETEALKAVRELEKYGHRRVDCVQKMEDNTFAYFEIDDVSVAFEYPKAVLDM